MCGKCRMDRVHAVCLDCRYSVKRWTWMLGKCPKCRKDLRNAGVAFRTPKKTDQTGWTDARFYVMDLEEKRHMARKKYGFEDR